jgi:hypothetical protein
MATREADGRRRRRRRSTCGHRRGRRGRASGWGGTRGPLCGSAAVVESRRCHALHRLEGVARRGGHVLSKLLERVQRSRYPHEPARLAPHVTVRRSRMRFSIRSRAVAWSTDSTLPLCRSATTSSRRSRRPSMSSRASASSRTQSSTADWDMVGGYRRASPDPGSPRADLGHDAAAGAAAARLLRMPVLKDSATDSPRLALIVEWALQAGGAGRPVPDPRNRDSFRARC